MARISSVVALQNLPGAVIGAMRDKPRFFFSPDNRYLFFTENRPDIEADTNVTTLRVFRVSDVVAGLNKPSVKPLWSVRMASRRGYGGLAGINEAQWDEEGRSVVFLGDTPSGQLAIYRLDVASGRLEQLTDVHQQLSPDVRFAYRAGTLLWTDVEQGPLRPLAYPVEPVIQDPKGGVMPRERARLNHFVIGGRVGERVIAPTQSLSFGTPILSASGHYALMMQVVRSGEEGQTRTGVWTIFDAAAGSYVPSLTFARPAATFWSTESDELVLVTQASGSEEGHIDLVDPATGHAQRIEYSGQKVTGGHWLAGRQAFVVLHGTEPAEIFEQGPSGWTPRPARAGELDAAPPIAVQLVQDVDAPPIIEASQGKRKTRLEGAVSALADVDFAPTRLFTWTDGHGKEMKGLLTLPQALPKGSRPALVIQADDNFDAEKDLHQFLPEGTSTGLPYATQALAGAGIAVLQINGKAGLGLDPAGFADRVTSAADALAKQGLVDRAHVGLTGAGRSASFIEHLITHPGSLNIAASTIHSPDGLGMTNYSEYLARGLTQTDSTLSMNAGAWTQLYGGSFWDAKQGWYDKAAIFNVDKVRGATLYSMPFGGKVVSPYDDFGLQEVVGAFRTAHRPFEYLIFGQGDDLLLNRPRERLALTHAVVDWYRFWLKGETPADAETAARWQKLKSDWQKQQTFEAEQAKAALLDPAASQALAPLPEHVADAPKLTNKVDVTFETTAGKVVVEVYPEAAPRAVQRFLDLVRSGFYDNTPVFRVATGFVAQFGINWRPAYSQWRESSFKDEPSYFRLQRGTLAFAKAGADANTTQIFISYGDNTHLARAPSNFTAFGKVITGMDVVDKFVRPDGTRQGLDQDRLWEDGAAYLDSLAAKPTMITSARILK